MTADISWLAQELGPEWRGGSVKIAGASKDQKLGRLLNDHRPFCVELH